jgi:hypothetical protein
MSKQTIFKCSDPQCGCFFFTQSDLDKHIAKFGAIHAIALKEMHQNLDKRYNSMEFSEADKNVSDFEKIVREHYNIPEKRRLQ